MTFYDIVLKNDFSVLCPKLDSRLEWELFDILVIGIWF